MRTPKEADASRTRAGRAGEARAAAALEEKGMRVIARNFRSARGEVDLIALDGQTIVFVEVKTWTFYAFEDLEYAVNKKKQHRIIETAKFFLAKHREYSSMAVRFDLVFIDNDTITHIASAFMECV